MAEMYRLEMWEAVSRTCEACGHRTFERMTGRWVMLGERKTRRAIINLANTKLSTGFEFRIMRRSPIKGWMLDTMRGVKGYGD